MRRRRIPLVRAICLMLIAAAIPGCAGARTATQGIEKTATQGIEKPESMVKAITREIPIGTPVDEAQRFMEAEGFRCRRETNARFGDRDGLDYLYCDRREGKFVERRWMIALVHRDGKVVEVLANTGLIGL